MSSEASKNSDESRDFEYMLYLHPDVHLDGTTADDRAESVFNLNESSKEQLKIKSEKADETENQTNSTEANSALNHAYSNSQLAISQASLKCRSVQNPLLNEQPKQKNGKHFLLNELTTRFARPRSCCSGGERISRGGRPSVTWKSHLAAYGSRGMASSFQTVNYSNEQMFSKHVRTEKNNSSVYCTPNAAQSNYFASLDAFFEYIAEYSLKAQKTLEMHEEFTSAKSSSQSYKDQNSNAKIQTNADGTNQTFTNEIRRLIVKCTEKNCPFFIKITHFYAFHENREMRDGRCVIADMNPSHSLGDRDENSFFLNSLGAFSGAICDDALENALKGPLFAQSVSPDVCSMIAEFGEGSQPPQSHSMQLFGQATHQMVPSRSADAKPSIKNSKGFGRETSEAATPEIQLKRKVKEIKNVFKLINDDEKLKIAEEVLHLVKSRVPRKNPPQRRGEQALETSQHAVGASLAAANTARGFGRSFDGDLHHDLGNNTLNAANQYAFGRSGASLSGMPSLVLSERKRKSIGTYKCRLCKKEGHNSRSCDAPTKHGESFCQGSFQNVENSANTASLSPTIDADVAMNSCNRATSAAHNGVFGERRLPRKESDDVAFGSAPALVRGDAAADFLLGHDVLSGVNDPMLAASCCLLETEGPMSGAATFMKGDPHVVEQRRSSTLYPDLSTDA